MAPNLLGSSAGLFLTAEAALGREDDKHQQQNQQQQIIGNKKAALCQQQQQQQTAIAKTANQQAVKAKEPSYRRRQLVWRNILAFIYLHTAALYGLYLTFFETKSPTNLFTFAIGILGGVGITAGAHRLWAHRAYKADWRLRTLLTICQTLAFQNHIYEWVRDHRVHHKFTDTDADPHNSQRGFFFSHIGWLMVKKHPDVKIKGSTVDMSDLEDDPIVMFQKKYYLIIMPVICFVLPTLIPYYLWGERIWVSYYVAAVFRYTLSLNMTWLVNSAAHIWGTKPYDTSISPTENVYVGYLAIGEGWHNYHHVFPWDYKAAELGDYNGNFTTGFIDFFAKLGWAYDLKTVSADMIRKRVGRTGDGSHRTLQESAQPEQKANGHSHGYTSEHTHEGAVWGWDDRDMTDEDKQIAQIVHKRKSTAETQQ